MKNLILNLNNLNYSKFNINIYIHLNHDYLLLSQLHILLFLKINF